MEEIHLKISNWDKHQPRKDLKSYKWFALSNDFHLDQKFHNFNSEEKLVWVYLLCEASKQAKGGDVVLVLDHWCRLIGISKKIVLQVIEKIESVRVAYRSVQIRTNPSRYTTLHNTTLHNKTEHNTVTSDETKKVYDFELLYKIYPLKKGKAAGLSRLNKIIKTQNDFDLMKLAIERYTADVQKKGTDPKYIKHFSSFIGSIDVQPWKDWLDDNAGSAIVMNSFGSGHANERTKNNLEALQKAMERLENE